MLPVVWLLVIRRVLLYTVRCSQAIRNPDCRATPSKKTPQLEKPSSTCFWATSGSVHVDVSLKK